jgi:hypothetical protein
VISPMMISRNGERVNCCRACALRLSHAIETGGSFW